MKLFILSVLLTVIISVADAQVAVFRTGEYMAGTSVVDLLGEAAAQDFAGKMPIDEQIHWEIYVPDTYQPDTAAGVLVFINSRDTGKIPEQWKVLMERHNLIWVGANDSGNDISIARRVAYAILAPTLVNNNYNINPDRVYISGFSGGGRVSSMVATEYNNLFKGAIYNSGANFWGEAASSRYEEMIDNHYVFITGTDDFNLDDTREVYNAYKKAGVNNSKLIIVPNMSHERPGAEDLEVAIEYLDSRLSQ